MPQWTLFCLSKSYRSWFGGGIWREDTLNQTGTFEGEAGDSEGEEIRTVDIIDSESVSYLDAFLEGGGGDYHPTGG